MCKSLPAAFLWWQKLPGGLPEIASLVVLREQRPCCDIFAGAERVFVEWRVELEVTWDIRGSGKLVVAGSQGLCCGRGRLWWS